MSRIVIDKGFRKRVFTFIGKTSKYVIFKIPRNLLFRLKTLF